MKKAKLIACLVAVILVLTLGLTACQKDVNRSEWIGDANERTDFTSVYDKIGSKVTIDQVKEDANGVATVTVDGITYTLGLDFLSMAMVYNCSVPEDGKWETREDVYNEWWKLYIQRWNQMVPEIPLYSNQYFDIYAAKIGQFQTSPFWDAAKAVVGATSTDGKIIIGNTTDLSGEFREPSFGKSSPGASDLAISNLTSGYDTVVATSGGAYIWNDDVVASHDEGVIDEKGFLTYTIEIKQGLKLSDGSEITADNYIAASVVGQSPLYGAAGGNSSVSPSLAGAAAFAAYDGTNDGKTVNKVTASKWLSGIKKLDTYKFSVTINPDYADYYYAVTYAGFSPVDVDIYLCGTELQVDPETKAVGLSDEFYAKSTESGAEVYTNAKKINENIHELDASKFAYSGPFVVKSYDQGTHTAVLAKNDQYVTEDYRKFNDNGELKEGNITEITYVKIVSETQTDMLKNGEVNLLEGITGAADTEAALALTKGDNPQFKETHYDRAGYGKLAFKCDYGATQFVEVRQAIMYSINRNDFATTFTGGYGTVVHGPYYEGMDAFQANKDTIKLNQYTANKDTALKLLTDNGWTLNEKGQEFRPGKDTVRYKELTGNYLSVANIQYESTDGKYGTVRLENKDGSSRYLIPLVINWSGTQPNEVTDLLKTSWAESQTVKDLGMYVTCTEGEFNPLLYGDYQQMEQYGYSRGDHPNVSAVNFATGFTSAVYDFSLNWSINPEYYADYNMQLMDPADFWADYQTK